MRKKRTFSMFGVEYRTTQLAAVPAFAILVQKDAHPCVLLEGTEVRDDNGEWQPLSEPKNIDKFVVDVSGAMVPRAVLNGLISLVRDFNFDFLREWRGVRVPGRFQSDGAAVKSSGTDPIIAQLIAQETATLQQLEEYYSLEDAFKMFDILVAKSVNEAVANEAASKAARKR